MPRHPSLFLAAFLGVLCACSNTVTIYDYSGHGKVPPDTVYVERPGAAPGDSTARRVPPDGGIPVPPDSTGGTPIHPGRWTSFQALIPGTARLQTICAPIDGMTTYRVIGNEVNGRGSNGTLELDPETRRSYDGAVEHSLILVFRSAGSWQERPASGPLLEITAAGQITAFEMGRIEQIEVSPSTVGDFEVRLWLPLTLEQMREIQVGDDVTVLLHDGERRILGVLSADNIQNLRTFFEIYMMGDGTKSMLPEGTDPGTPVLPPGAATLTTDQRN